MDFFIVLCCDCAYQEKKNEFVLMELFLVVEPGI